MKFIKAYHFLAHSTMEEWEIKNQEMVDLVEIPTNFT
jgi:hypothetical protein